MRAKPFAKKIHMCRRDQQACCEHGKSQNNDKPDPAMDGDISLASLFKCRSLRSQPTEYAIAVEIFACCVTEIVTMKIDFLDLIGRK